MKTSDIHIRDPFVLVHDGRTYLYGTRQGSALGLDVYVGTDLQEWEGPFEVFTPPADFWADRDFWAPEVHAYQGAFYMLVSFKAADRCRGTQILRADSPMGPFRPISGGPVTPADWECLDGTLYVDGEGRPYMVFCHEWVQIKDGTVCAMPLSPDLTRAAGEPWELFRASRTPWIRPLRQDNYVTDGPFLHRLPSGELLLLWSSFSRGGYTLGTARSRSGRIDGEWVQDEQPVFSADGGHGMVFTGLDGVLYLTLHTPNAGPLERPAFYRLSQEGNRLTVAQG